MELALLGAGTVAPNPMVGAVLVYNDLIIGEGYHQQYGHPHAEVNCIKSVREESKYLIEKATLYVSLEPCAHFGKTPPCCDLIIENNIPVVVVACRDSYEQVNGKGIQRMQEAGIEVIFPMLEAKAIDINKRFFTFHNKHRPYIILKWAQTANEKIANSDYSRLVISNEITNREVHKWRSMEASILVGTTTALRDNPSLTTRFWPGNNPIRLVIDKELKLDQSFHLLDGTAKTIVFNTLRHEDQGAIFYYKLFAGKSFIKQIIMVLYQLNVLSVLVEGGTILLQSFIDEDCWDEARVIVNNELTVAAGIKAPVLSHVKKISSQTFLTDTIHYYEPLQPL